MISKTLIGDSLFIYLPERYERVYNKKTHVETESGIILRTEDRAKEIKQYEEGTVLQIGNGKDREGRWLTDTYSVGDKIRIRPRQGTDLDVYTERPFTYIKHSDVIDVL